MQLRTAALLLALLALPSFLLACVTGRRSSGGDDDDAGDDDAGDDDAGDDDAGDDDAGDDDAGDDDAGDDDAGDDDAGGPEPTWGTSTIAGEYLLTYNSGDTSSPDPYCAQAFSFTANGTHNQNAMGGNCADCTGRIDFLFAQDVTDTSDLIDDSTIDRCDFLTHFEGNAGLDLGDILTNPANAAGVAGADFIQQLGLIDRETGFASDLAIAADGDPSYASMAAQPPPNAVLSHVGYIQESADRYFSPATGLGTVAATAPGTTDWLAFWVFYTPQGNIEGGMQGEYVFQAAWVINFNPDAGLPFSQVQFSGRMTTQFTPAP
jgi:hypothetical protein